jgi:tRNA pseudouridine55 synthase
MKSSFHGLLVVDKPSGMTSRDAVDRAQRWFPRGTRVGHTGTLDPLATGVLVLCVGVATRLTEYVQRMSKTYRAGLRLGARSDTDDADGTITPVVGGPIPERDAIAQEVRTFVGELEQVPPAYSAAKLTGRRAYDLARQGEEVNLQPRRIRIDAIDLLEYDHPRLVLEVRCGKGTYIRSLARDLGERLGCGALVETLRRMRVGGFDAADAIGLDVDAATARARLLPPAAAVADLPQVRLDPRTVDRLRQGQGVALRDGPIDAQMHGDGQDIAVFDGAGNLAAIGEVDLAQRLLLPTKVLPCC